MPGDLPASPKLTTRCLCTSAHTCSPCHMPCPFIQQVDGPKQASQLASKVPGWPGPLCQPVINNKNSIMARNPVSPDASTTRSSQAPLKPFHLISRDLRTRHSLPQCSVSLSAKLGHWCVRTDTPVQHTVSIRKVGLTRTFALCPYWCSRARELGTECPAPLCSLFLNLFRPAPDEESWQGECVLPHLSIS